MKRLTALTVALLIGVTMFAQQALWGTAPVVSPEIHDNNTVTFRFKAPKAVRVQLTGDFLPVQKNAKFEAPGIVDLKEGQEGVWEYTTPEPLKPELYSYSFIVDGLRMNDPANVYLIRDVSTLTNVFIIGGDRADFYKVNPVPHGTVSRIWYDSPALGLERRMTVYTPAGYETSGKRYPVLYLLHGMGVMKRHGFPGPYCTDTGQPDCTRESKAYDCSNAERQCFTGGCSRRVIPWNGSPDNSVTQDNGGIL